jgi:hypothetical protein
MFFQHGAILRSKYAALRHIAALALTQPKGSGTFPQSPWEVTMVRTLVLSLAACAAMWAQTSTGNISGSVEDTSGARVPNAKVTITHAGTQQTRTVSTNERGEYLAPLMPIGECVISGEMEGFKRKVLSGILLRVDQTLTVPIVIEPGNVREIVEVRGSAPLLDTETSSLGQVIDNKRVLDLPLNGRNVFALGLLAGNTTEVFGMGTNQTFAAGGGRFSGNEIMLDGISDNTIMNRGSVGRNSVLYTPSVDALEEFKVKTNNFSAEFGHAAGAVVSATVKSGSNSPHGVLWEFLRNDKLDANNFFSNAAARPKAPFRQNQFGGALGGPVYIPRLYRGRDRTFFFMDYEGTRRRTAASSSINDVAPLAFREGDFAGLPQRVYDPKARRFLFPCRVFLPSPSAARARSAARFFIRDSEAARAI